MSEVRRTGVGRGKIKMIDSPSSHWYPRQSDGDDDHSDGEWLATLNESRYDETHGGTEESYAVTLQVTNYKITLKLQINEITAYYYSGVILHLLQ